MKILIIPEDPTLDQHILRPIVERICSDHGIKARVEVLRDPHLRGVSQALDRDIVAGIVRDNPMEDLFILMVDRDCDRLGNTTKAATRVEEHPGRVLACLACEEVEVWMLALHRKQIGVPWTTVRGECDPKERFADPFIASRGRRPGRLIRPLPHLYPAASDSQRRSASRAFLQCSKRSRNCSHDSVDSQACSAKLVSLHGMASAGRTHDSTQPSASSVRSPAQASLVARAQ